MTSLQSATMTGLNIACAHAQQSSD